MGLNLINMGSKLVQIPDKELERLRKRDEMLTALENGGVDNWDGYGWAIEDHLKEYGLSDDYFRGI